MIDGFTVFATDAHKHRSPPQGFWGSRKFMEPEEERIARMLTEMKIKWEYETLLITCEIDIEGKPKTICGACCDFFLPDFEVFLEIKRGKSRKGRQRRLARAAGFGFAIVSGWGYNDLRLKKKIEVAIKHAVAARDGTRKFQFPLRPLRHWPRDGVQPRLKMKRFRRVVFVPVEHAG